jgi:heterodisulfide reductase subunit A-like polyferredoxin
MNTLPFEIESEFDVDYAIVHSQLCGEGGVKVMEDILRSAEDDPDTIVIVGACEPEAQQKLFKKLLRKTGFDQDHLVAIDIRNATNDGILDRLRERIEELVHPKDKHH